VELTLALLVLAQQVTELAVFTGLAAIELRQGKKGKIQVIGALLLPQAAGGGVGAGLVQRAKEAL
jgi:hypothetical protein